MSANFRLSIGSHAAAIAAGAVAAATYLTVYSAGPQSLADYILSDMREIVWYRVRRRGSLPRRECQRDDKNDDRHGHQAVRRCRH